MQTPATQRQTAQAAYSDLAASIAAKLELATRALPQHAPGAASVHWGYVGDLGEVDRLLDAVNRILGNPS